LRQELTLVRAAESLSPPFGSPTTRPPLDTFQLLEHG